MGLTWMAEQDWPTRG